MISNTTTSADITTANTSTSAKSDDSRITLSESPEEAFAPHDDAIVPAPKPRSAHSGSKYIKGLQTNKVFPQKLPPITTKIKKVKKMSNKINSGRLSESVTDGFHVSWTNLSYIVEKSSFPYLSNAHIPKVRVILKCLSGSFNSSELTAVMGPSGAGKSSLLACVCGKRTTGVSGDIRIVGCKRIKVAIIAQNDYLTDKFTLREALLFASKTKNGLKKVDHEEVINNVVNALSLETCLDNRLGKCSGGQRRRVSIALELVSNPNILILDEPTSGLDSSACFQIIENLRDLTQHKKNPMAIVATIHQPSARVFNMFHNVYVISHNGQCIYHGPPDNIVHHLSVVNLSVPEFHNPADYIAEIASGEHGEDSITRLATHRKESLINGSQTPAATESSHKLSEMSQKYKFPLILHTFLLIGRSLRLVVREPHLSWIRLGASVSTGFFLSFVFAHSDLGRVAGCPPRMEGLYTTRPTDLFKNAEYEHKRIEENLGSIFFSAVFLLYSGILPTLMTFPKEFNCLIKHYTNGWYSVFTYYLSKIIVDLPLIFITTFIYLTIWYLVTSQIPEMWRYWTIILAGILIMLNGQSQGMICSAWYSRDPVAASYLSIVTSTPFFLLSGYLVRSKRMPDYIRPVTAISHTKYAFESMVIAIYGYQRCWYQESNQTLVQPPWLRFLRVMTASMVDNNKEDTFDDDDSYLVVNNNNNTTNSSGGNDGAGGGSGGEDDGAMNDILALFSGRHAITDNKYQSMVMSEFEFTDDMLPYNLLVLLLYTIIFQFIAYIVLIRKLRKTT